MSRPIERPEPEVPVVSFFDRSNDICCDATGTKIYWRQCPCPECETERLEDARAHRRRWPCRHWPPEGQECAAGEECCKVLIARYGRLTAYWKPRTPAERAAGRPGPPITR